MDLVLMAWRLAPSDRPQAKDERIKKLDKAKLTTDQVEKLQKLKREWAQFQTEVRGKAMTTRGQGWSHIR